MDPASIGVFASAFLTPELTSSMGRSLAEFLERRRVIEASRADSPGAMSEAERAELERFRVETLKRLKTLHSEIMSLIADRVLIQKYSSLLVGFAAQLYASKTVQEVDLIDLQLNQIQAAWGHTKRNEEARARALTSASKLFSVLVLVLIVLGSVGLGTSYYMGQSIDLAGYMVPMVNIPLYVVVWSAIGSCAAVLYRVNWSTSLEAEDPARLIVTRPIVGVVMGIVSYLIVQLGVLTLASEPAAGTVATPGSSTDFVASSRTVYFFSLMSFLMGFSDRFADSVLRSLVGRFGGDKDADLVAAQAIGSSADARVLQAFIEAIGRDDAQPAAEKDAKVEAEAEAESHDDKADPEHLSDHKNAGTKSRQTGRTSRPRAGTAPDVKALPPPVRNEKPLDEGEFREV